MKHIKCVLKTVFASYIVTVVLLLITTAILYKFQLSIDCMNVIKYVISAISVFVGGFIAGKAQKEKRLLWGMGIGVIYCVILLIISGLSVTFTGLETSTILIRSGVCIFFGILGGIFS